MKLIKKIIRCMMDVMNIRYALPNLVIHKNRMTTIKRFIPGESPLVIDGGAHKGEFIDLILRQYSDPVIYGYEPIPLLASALKDKYARLEKISIRQAALGAIDTTMELCITRILSASSFLESGIFAQKYHNEGMNVEEKINVLQIRLDAEINRPVDILKLDLQGYELEALKGSINILEGIKLILVEIEFVPLYKDQPLFAEVDIFLRGHDFRLLNLYDLYTHMDEQLTSGDAIYLNNKFFN